MSRITATEARRRLFQLVDEVAESHIPVRIAGRRNEAVLVAESDWRAIEETLFLCGIPGMREGGRRELVIPPRLAYGESGGHRLAGCTLIFVIDLLQVG